MLDDGVERDAKGLEEGRGKVEVQDIREALDQLELGGDLAALLGDLLLGSGEASQWVLLVHTARQYTYCSSWVLSAPSLRET